MKKLLSVISLLLCVTLTFSSCGKKVENSENPTAESQTQAVGNTENSPAEQPTTENGKITLPVNETDGLNPFFAKSYENLYLAYLLYEPLFFVDAGYNAVPAVAQSITVNGTTATVTIKSDAACRGAGVLNASDVVYSFNLAKASYGWSGELAGITSASARNGNTVDFTLEFCDSFVAEKLSFPIVKSGTADIPEAVPTGSGKYYYNEKKLISIADVNKIIELYPVGTNQSSENAFKIGTTDVYFSDLADCNYAGVTGKTENLLLNNMVYLGFNSSRPALDKNIRSAVAAKLNCEDLSVSAYQGHAVPIKLPVNPLSDTAKEIAETKVKGDGKTAAEILDRCGYLRYSGSALTNGSNLLSFTLIVNNDNRYRVAAAYNIADSLNECGFLIRVQAISFDEYNKKISSGDFDMYLGEIRLDGSMDISVFFGDGVYSNGIDKTEKAVTEYYKYRAGEISAKEYYGIFSEYYPFVPVLFRKGYAIFSKNVNPDLNYMPYNLYGGL